MGCFLGCFGSSKDRKRRKLRYKVIPRDQKPRIQDILKVDVSLEQSIIERPSNPFPESREKKEAPLSLKRQKKVTFDTNVTTYEHIQVFDSTESLLARNEKGETFPKSQPNASTSKEDSVVLSMPNYRYGNCIESDDEIDDLDLDDDEDDYDLDDEEHYDDEEQYDDDKVSVLSVLNPVENLSQWKALKSRTRKPSNFDEQKENSNPPKPEDRNQELAVDASLANWLISSEKITRNNKRFASELEVNTTSEFRG